MSRYEIERDIDGFIERWLERTADFDDLCAGFHRLVCDAALRGAAAQHTDCVGNWTEDGALVYA